MTDNVIPGTFTPNYTSRNRVTHPPMYTHGGSSIPGLLPYLDKVVGFLMPRTRVSSLVPDSLSVFRILVPRSGFSFHVPDLIYRFITIYLYFLSRFKNLVLFPFLFTVRLTFRKTGDIKPRSRSLTVCYIY